MFNLPAHFRKQTAIDVNQKDLGPIMLLIYSKASNREDRQNRRSIVNAWARGGKNEDYGNSLLFVSKYCNIFMKQLVNMPKTALYVSGGE